MERKEFDLDAEFCILAISIQGHSKEKFLDYDKLIRLHLTKFLYNYNDRFNIFRQDKHLIVVLQDFPQEIVKNALERLNEICNYGQRIKIHAGVSVNDFGIKSLPRGYKRAISILRIAEKQDKSYLFYSNIGFLQLLLEVDDNNTLKRFYDETLGQLEDYDKKNQTDLLNTLRCYLDNNASVQEVAKVTYVHRNTINYKIKKIKEILNCDLNYQDGLKLFLAFHAKELL